MIISKLEALVKPLTQINMDMTHIRMLNEILTIGKFKDVLEIGSYDGASAIAFIAALNDNAVDQVSFCDIFFQPRFHTVLLEGLYQGGITLERRSSLEVLNAHLYDFVFVDGDHSLQTVREELSLLLKHGVKHIAAHDTSSSAIGIPACEGAAYLKYSLKNNPDYHVIEDNRVRPGENTGRGFMFATTDAALSKRVMAEIFYI